MSSSPVSVSYTHLDVYKRQVEHRAAAAEQGAIRREQAQRRNRIADIDPILGIGDDILRAQKGVPDRQQFAICREALDAAVLTIGYDDATVAEHADAVWRQEGARCRSDRAPTREQITACLLYTSRCV